MYDAFKSMKWRNLTNYNNLLLNDDKLSIVSNTISFYVFILCKFNKNDTMEYKFDTPINLVSFQGHPAEVFSDSKYYNHALYILINNKNSFYFNKKKFT